MEKKTQHKVWESTPLLRSANTPPRPFVCIAGFLGALAVGLGAYGAHVLKPVGPLEKVYHTANLYHHLYSLLLLAIGYSKRPYLTGTMLTVGVLLFSGSCYLHVFTDNKNWSQGAPFGGILLLLSWLTFFL